MQRLFVPEVVQTSAMDCGPACLKSLLNGFGIPASYDRIREACQTDLDGTSIDTIEQIAGEMGLEAEQIMVPVDHLLLREARALPGLVVVRLPNAMTHFMVLWRRHRQLLEVMDPAEGRQWLSAKAFAGRIHIHAQAVPAADWREWAGSTEFLQALHHRARRIGLSKSQIAAATGAALSDPGWRSIASLDAAIRMLAPMVAYGGCRGSKTVNRILQQFLEKSRASAESLFQVIPPAYWSVLPARDAEPGEQLVFRGAVVLRVKGRKARWNSAPQAEVESGPTDLPRKLHESPVPAMRQLVRYLREDGFLSPVLMMCALMLGAAGVVAEALFYRTLLNITSTLGLSEQRLGALLMLFGFIGGLLILDWLHGAALLRSGRKLETRLRAHILYAIPRLPDRYFGSRLVSDMAERSHAIHEIRSMPLLAGMFLYLVCQLGITALAIILLDPSNLIPAVSCATLAIVLPLLLQPLLAERDLRFRTHEGTLCRFYFDALRGLMPVRAHAAEESIRSEHESLLSSWARSGLSLQRAAVAMDAAGLAISMGLVIWLVGGSLTRSTDSAQALLLVYWALNIPVLGTQIAQIARRYPRERNLARRILEPLQAPNSENSTEMPVGPGGTGPAREEPVSLIFDGVSVRALGQTILEPFDLNIQAGSHVCIVGRSGAGKSTLVGLLLGWHQPATGRILVDGALLEEGRLQALRRQTAWVDPNIQIWNRSLIDNLRYGLAENASATAVGQVIEDANLVSLLEKLPDGSQTRLGESGALISGGEGQRVRFGRAMLRRSARLVILDEPFSALDRTQRHELMQRARAVWKDATLLCITHDVAESRHFDRVLVMERGHIVEDGPPTELLAMPNSRYRGLFEAEEAAQSQVWSGDRWRRLFIEEGRLLPGGAAQRHDRYTEGLLAGPSSERSYRGLVPQDEAPAKIR